LPFFVAVTVLPSVALYNGDIALPYIALCDLVHARAVYAGALHFAWCSFAVSACFTLTEYARHMAAISPKVSGAAGLLVFNALCVGLPNVFLVVSFISPEGDRSQGSSMSTESGAADGKNMSTNDGLVQHWTLVGLVQHWIPIMSGYSFDAILSWMVHCIATTMVFLSFWAHGVIYLRYISPHELESRTDLKWKRGGFRCLVWVLVPVTAIFRGMQFFHCHRTWAVPFLVTEVLVLVLLAFIMTVGHLDTIRWMDAHAPILTQADVCRMLAVGKDDCDDSRSIAKRDTRYVRSETGSTSSQSSPGSQSSAEEGARPGLSRRILRRLVLRY
jgi:hypothetical protein